MSEALNSAALKEIHIWIEGEKLFEFGRVFRKVWTRGEVGEVRLKVQGGKLTVESYRGGGELPCLGKGEVNASMTAREFCALTAQGQKIKSTAPLRLTFRPQYGEIAFDNAGAKAKFL